MKKKEAAKAHNTFSFDLLGESARKGKRKNRPTHDSRLRSFPLSLTSVDTKYHLGPFPERKGRRKQTTTQPTAREKKITNKDDSVVEDESLNDCRRRSVFAWPTPGAERQEASVRCVGSGGTG